MIHQSWLPHGLDPILCERLAVCLLHFLWQAAAMCALVIGVAAFLQRRSAQSRYLIHLLCLSAMAACVPLNFVIFSEQSMPTAETIFEVETPTADHAVSSEPKSGLPADVQQDLDGETAADRSIAVSTQTIPVSVSTQVSASTGFSAEDLYVPPGGWPAWVVTAWICGALLMLVRLAVSQFASYRMVRASLPVTQSNLLHAARVQAQRVGLAVSPALAWCADASVPVVAGVVRPLVLLPPSLLTGLDTIQIDAILAHEFAHIRRWDPWFNVLQRVVEAVLFFHPAVWYVSRQVSAERENCCDDIVVGSGTRRLDYADALVRMAEICVARRVSAASLAASGESQSDLKRRVLRLLYTEPAAGRSGGFVTLLGIVVLVIAAPAALLIASNSAPPQPVPNSVGHPEGVVAVLGEDRARIWGYTRQIVTTSDHKRLFVTEAIGHVSIFDADTLKRIAQFRPHAMRCLDVALLKADTRLVTISVDGSARLWDVTTPTPKQLDEFVAFDGSADSGWLSMSVAGKSNRLALRWNEQIVVLELRDDILHRLAEIPNRAEDTPFQYALSPDGRWLVTCEDQKTIELIEGENGIRNGYRDAVLAVWDLSEEKPRVASELKRKSVQGLMFSPDGRFLFGPDPTFVPNRETYCWTFRDGELAEILSYPGGPTAIAPIVMNPDGSRMAFSTREGTEVFRKAEEGWAREAQLDTGRSQTCAFVDDESLVVLNAPELQRWDLMNGKYEKRPAPTGHRSIVRGIVFDGRKNSLLSIGGDKIRSWPLADITATGAESQELGFENATQIWPWSDKKGFLLRRSVAGSTVIEGVRRGVNQLLVQFKIDLGDDYRESAWCAVMHPRREILATGHWDSHIRLWDVTSSPPQQMLFWRAHRGHVCGIAFSPEGDQIASVGWDHQVKMWTFDANDLTAKPTGRLIGSHADIVRSVDWSHDGRYLASGGEDGQILFWDLSDRGRPKSLMQPEDGPPKRNTYDQITVGSLQFSRDGNRLLSCDAKGRLTLWSTKDLQIKKRWQLSGWIWDARFSPDEKMIATANGDGTVYLLRNEDREK